MELGGAGILRTGAERQCQRVLGALRPPFAEALGVADASRGQMADLQAQLDRAEAREAAAVEVRLVRESLAEARRLAWRRWLGLAS